MSQYLVIGKNNVDIISFIRSDKVYKAFDLYSEDKKQLTKSEIYEAQNNVEENIKELKITIANYNKIFKQLTSIEDMTEILRCINDYKNELEEWNNAQMIIDLIYRIVCECTSEDNLYYYIS